MFSPLGTTTNLPYIFGTLPKRRNEGRKTKLGVGPKLRFPRIGKRLKFATKIPSYIHVQTTKLQRHFHRTPSQCESAGKFPKKEKKLFSKNENREPIPRSKIGTRQMRNIYVTRKHTHTHASRRFKLHDERTTQEDTRYEYSRDPEIM